jgi:hypothetical protein
MNADNYTFICGHLFNLRHLYIKNNTVSVSNFILTLVVVSRLCCVRSKATSLQAKTISHSVFILFFAVFPDCKAGALLLERRSLETTPSEGAFKNRFTLRKFVPGDSRNRFTLRKFVP